jgi:hypothetical protein
MKAMAAICIVSAASTRKGCKFCILKKGAIDDEKGAIRDIKGANGDKKGCNSLHPLYNQQESSKKHQEPSLRASRLKKEWLLPKSWNEWALKNDPTITAWHLS